MSLGNISYLLLKNLSPILFLSPHQDFFKLRLIREGHKLCSNLLEGHNFQDLTFSFTVWFGFGKLPGAGRGTGWETGVMYDAKKVFLLWKFIFHILIWEHKRETWFSLQKENRWTSSAVCGELESFAKRIWAYIRLGSYLSMMRPESSNSDKTKCSVHQYPPKGDFTPSNGI